MIKATLDVLGWSLLGRAYPTSPMEIHDLVLQGLPADTLSYAKRALDDGGGRLLAGVLGVSPRALGRYERQAGKVLPVRVGGRLLEVAECLVRAEAVVGSRKAALAWLRAPCLALGGEAPIGACQTAPGIAAVRDLLGRLEYGIYT